MSQKTKNSNLIVDFIGGAVGHRFRSGEGRKQTLAKAAGFTSNITPFIVDATAGLGRDAFFLASLGAKIILIERSKKMHQLLEDGMQRAAAEGGRLAETIARMTLIHGDSNEILPELKPQVVLVDPMHPPRGNSALVKKEMRQIREIVGTDPDAEKLMQVALEHAQNRVVLKWPLRAAPMANIRQASHQILGKSTRYDVFVNAKLAAPEKE